MQYSKMRLYVGLFVLTLIGVVSTFMFLLLEEKGTFEKRYNYHFITSSADSFSVGMPLKFSGFKIGVIDNIELQSDGNVYMTFSVNEKNQKWIGVDSVLMLKKPLIGSAHIVVDTKVGNRVLEAGGVLQMVVSDDINDMISKLEPVVDKLINIIESVDAITATMAHKDSDLMQTLHNINTFSAKLSKNDSLLTTVTGDKTSTKSIIEALNTSKTIVDDIKKITQDLSTISASLNQKIVTPAEVSMQNVEAIFKDIREKLQAIDGTVKSVGSYDKELIELKEQISVGLQKSNQIMDKVDALMSDEKNQEILLP